MRPTLILLALFISINVFAQRTGSKRFQHEQVSFEDMIHRYLHRDGTAAQPVEGIYSVSCVITKTKRHWLTGKQISRTVEQKDNYARVAIIKETMDSKRDFIEVSMSNRDASKYPVVGELSEFADGAGFKYIHKEPDGSIMTFSMLLTHADLLEGQFVVTKRKQLITTRLSYFKLFPKVDSDPLVFKR